MMIDSRMQVACATDRSYLEMTGVLIASLSSQPHQRPLSIYVFCTKLREDDKAKLVRCVQGNAELVFIDIDPEKSAVLARLTARRHLSVTAYSRILIPDMIPDVSGRILYLDCDIVINAPLDDLFLIPLDGHPAGAAPNPVIPERLSGLNIPLGRPPQAPYFNSGVLLIDMDEWRRQKISEKGMTFAATWKAQSGDHDQAVLNYVLDGNWQQLDQKWNFNPGRLSPEEARVMPVQHFWGRGKPFFAEYPKPYREVYDRYRALTPWAKAWRNTRFERSFTKRWKIARKSLKTMFG